jgi:spoIIIJ-associated protein
MDDRTSIEITATSVETAITEGLAQLGVAQDQVRIEVLDEGSRGVLGFGARDAVVRLTPLSPPPTAVEVVADRERLVGLAEPQELAERIEPEDVEPEPVVVPPEAGPPAKVVAREVLSELLNLMGIQARVQIRQTEDTPTEEDAPPFVLDIVGNDLGILIGRRGQTLHDLQYMTRLIASREVGEWVHLVVDVEKYKVRREKALQQLANRLAERVVLTQQPIALEPMPPHERRIIHITLRDHPIVTTQSVGKGDRRKVTIIPNPDAY